MACQLMVIWPPKSENMQEWSGKTSINEVKHLRNGLMHLETCAKNTFARWRDDGKSCGIVTITGRLANLRQRCIRYGTISTTKRPLRTKTILRMRAAHHTRKQGPLAQTQRTGLEAVLSPKFKPMNEQCQKTQSKTSMALIVNSTILSHTYR